MLAVALRGLLSALSLSSTLSATSRDTGFVV